MIQINAVEAPIINSPYDEPQHHWYIEAAKPPEKRPGRRMASSYFFQLMHVLEAPKTGAA